MCPELGVRARADKLRRLLLFSAVNAPAKENMAGGNGSPPFYQRKAQVPIQQ
jgi:hypothetical protein